MSASAVGSVLACSELQVVHPRNDAATCWWLSVNFALFHKDRPEITEFINKNDDISKVYKQISEYYTGKGGTKETILELRKSKELQIFNTTDFTIDKNSFQDAAQYISKLLGNKELAGAKEKTLIQIEIYHISDEHNEPLLYDIRLHMLAKGIEVPLFNRSKNSTPSSYSIQDYKLSESNTSFILYFPRSPREKKADGTSDETKPIANKLKVLKELYMPIDNNIIKYELDAFVGAQSGHYYSAAKCGTTEQWQEHGNNGINATKTYDNFQNMMKENTKLEQEATLLFYTRVETAAAPTTSVAIPAPLPGPPGSAALPAGLPAPPSSALAVPAPLPEPPALAAAADADVPEPLPEPPALAAPAAADAAVPAAANAAVPEPPALAAPAAANAAVPAPLPEPPAPLPEPPVPPPPAAAASAAPPPSLAAAAPMPPARS